MRGDRVYVYTKISSSEFPLAFPPLRAFHRWNDENPESSDNGMATPVRRRFELAGVTEEIN